MSHNGATLFGLPEEVKFCKRCVISNQRPSSCIEYAHAIDTPKTTIQFDSEGICSACRVVELKKNTDWSDRDRQLRELCDRHRRSDGKPDCLVPGSGGKDSFFQALTLKEKYGMMPLTVTWRPALYTDIGWANHTAWVDAGLDNYLMSPNGKVHRLLTKLGVENLYHPFQTFMIGQKNLAPKIAKLFGIKLVFYGENESEFGNAIVDMESAKRSFSYFTSNTPESIFLAGTSVDELKKRHGLTNGDLDIYMPSNPQELEEAGVEVRYLGYYLRWHPQSCYYFASDHGFRRAPERTPGTYSVYNSLDDKIDDWHYYTTYIKYGIGRATYDAAQEIRSGDIDREEGVALVKRYDGEYPDRFENDLLDYVSMTKGHFMDLADKFRSPHLWTKYDGQWQLRHTVYEC